MATFPYVLVPNKIAGFLDQIKRVNKPSRVTYEWLESNAYKSSNDRGLIGLLKSLGYLDASGVPTAQWSELKGNDEQRKASIGRQLRVAYPEIFKHYPVETVQTLTREEIKDFVRPRISAGKATVDNIASTFLALRSMCTFDGPTPAPATGTSVAAAPREAPRTSAASEALNVTINLSLELPPTADKDVYDKLFEAMAKHLGDLLRGGS